MSCCVTFFLELKLYERKKIVPSEKTAKYWAGKEVKSRGGEKVMLLVDTFWGEKGDSGGYLVDYLMNAHTLLAVASSPLNINGTFVDMIDTCGFSCFCPPGFGFFNVGECMTVSLHFRFMAGQ